MAKTNSLQKSYENLDFLNSPAARSIRVLCEFVEPEHRFRSHRLKNTIVFFGSARTLPAEQARKRLGRLQEPKRGKTTSASRRKEELERAKADLVMSRYYEDAEKLAYKLTKWAMKIPVPTKRFSICSGGGPGIMEAANKGALEAGGKSIGLNISLPLEQDPNPFQTPDLAFEFHYFFIRKFWFFYLAKAIVVFPGGFGTMDELFELLTLVQTEKTKKYMPILIYGAQYWKEVINFEAMVKWGNISPEDLKLFRFVDDVDAAYQYLTRQLTKHYLKDLPARR